MFGSICIVHDIDRKENVFDRLMNVFDEPFMESFRAPDFKVDIKDNGDKYNLKAELPGLKKEDISLTYKGNYFLGIYKCS